MLGVALPIAMALAVAGCGGSSSPASTRTYPPVAISTQGWPTLPAHVDLASLGERSVEGTEGCRFIYDTRRVEVSCDDAREGTGEVKTNIPAKKPSCWKAVEYECSASGGVEVRTSGETSEAAVRLMRAVISQLGGGNPLGHPAKAAAWDFSSRLSGGYVIAGSFTLGAPHHISSGTARECPTDMATDAEMDGEMKISNATPKFPAQPEVTISLDLEPEAMSTFSLALGGECTGAPGSLTRMATEPVETGGQFDDKYSVVVPGYYSPEFPQGNPEVLSGLAMIAGVFNREGTSPAREPVPVSFTGPMGERTELIELAQGPDQ